MLGIPQTFYNLQVTESPVPVSFRQLTGIRIGTNLSIASLPVVGQIAYVPIDNCFGDIIEYYDEGVSDWSLVMDNEMNHLHISLLDQDGHDLTTRLPITDQTQPGFYEQFGTPWTIVFRLVSIYNEGYQELPVSVRTYAQSTLTQGDQPDFNETIQMPLEGFK